MNALSGLNFSVYSSVTHNKFTSIKHDLCQTTTLYISEFNCICISKKYYIFYVYMQ